MIFRGSRYTNTEVEYNENGDLAFKDRALFKINMRNCTEYVFCEGDRLDLLANRFYSDPRMWWVILEANTNYSLEEQINVGDIIKIPFPSEVNNLYVK